MPYFLYASFGILPSIIWLLYYLRKDVHPEPKRMIIKIFLLGAVIAPLVVLIECLPLGCDKEGGLICFFRSFFLNSLPNPWGIFFYMLLIVGFTEEFLKYVVVKLNVLKNPVFDEPIDVMLYMIIAALGFAAVENTLVLFSIEKTHLIQQVSFYTVYRFIAPTFLHTLCSGTIGYFVARSFCDPKHKWKFLFLGFSTATFLHGLFNFSIIRIGDSLAMLNNQLVIVDQQMFTVFSVILSVILIGLAFFTTIGFQKLKKMKSVCKIHLT